MVQIQTHEPATSVTQVTVPLAEERTGLRTSMSVGDVSIPSDYVKTYRIVLETDEDGRCVVTCPDLDGIVTDGASEEEAVLNAYEAVKAMLESFEKDEEFILVSYNV